VGGQGIERREILRYIGIASVAGTFPGFQRWAFACAHELPVAAIGKATSRAYKPLFFSPAHYAMVERLTEIVIPADDTPGAKEAGVAEFIDFMVANRVPISSSEDMRTVAETLRQGSAAQARFVEGLNWMNAHSKAEFGKVFLDGAAEQQHELLEGLAYRAKFKPGTDEGREFFQLVRDYTVVGYYTTKIGLESLGYPGLRMVWPSMPRCPHPDDPEHAHLMKSNEAISADGRTGSKERQLGDESI
jgi:gluconate 2-dehydrogenase gamma chain